MPALDGLSIAANVLQITGFADTVFRAGRNLYELFDKARSVSRAITLLLFELQALLSVVASVHVFANEYASSPFAYDDSHTLANVHTILTLIDQDFRHVRGLLVRTAGSGRQGWLSSLQSSILWALKDDEITASRQRLSQYTQNLTIALSISGRINVSEQADRTLVADTGNYALDQITKPVMLLRDLLVDSLGASGTRGAVANSEPQAVHLQMLIDFLAASAHTASAEALMKTYGDGSETRLVERRCPGRIFRGSTVQKRSLGFGRTPAYLEEKSMTVETRIGSVRATILSARTREGSKTLVFTFEYAGDLGLGLSPFAVHFMSHALLTALPLSEWQPALPDKILPSVAARVDDEHIFFMQCSSKQGFSKSVAVCRGGAGGFVAWVNVGDMRMPFPLLHYILMEVVGRLDEEADMTWLAAVETSDQLCPFLNRFSTMLNALWGDLSFGCVMGEWARHGATGQQNMVQAVP